MKKPLVALLAGLSIAAQAAVTPLPGVTPQRAVALSPFPTQVAVRVTDASGAPVANAAATFSHYLIRLASGPDTRCKFDFASTDLLVCKAMTDADGIARFPALQATQATSFTTTVFGTNDIYPNPIRYGETTLTFTVDPIQPPVQLEITEGDNQHVAMGTAFAPVTVRVATPQGQGVAGARLWYSLYGGPAGEAYADSAGLAKLPTFNAGWGLGAQSAEISYFDAAAAARVVAMLKYTVTTAQGGMTMDLGGLWWGGPSESGWGMSTTQRGDLLFNVWFVYDETSRPTWFVQPGGRWDGGFGNFYSGYVFWPRSAPWFAYDASLLSTGPSSGQGLLRFNGPQVSWVGFGVDLGTNGPRYFNKRVEPQLFGGNDPGPIPGVGGLWWGGPSQNGWGVAVHEQGSKLFIVWFTYDADGMPTWFVMPDGTWSDDRTHAGAVYRTSGTPWTKPFDPAGVRVTPVGSYSLRFDSRDVAWMEVNIEGRSVTLALERQLF